MHETTRHTRHSGTIIDELTGDHLHYDSVPTVAEQITQIKVEKGIYDLDSALTANEWLDVIACAQERGVTIHELVHDAVMADLYR